LRSFISIFSREAAAAILSIPALTEPYLSINHILSALTEAGNARAANKGINNLSIKKEGFYTL
tara:strand:+ start:198 stop:386 length:189 start_codon:yes stop_codon:yes gene_type:complete